MNINLKSSVVKDFIGMLSEKKTGRLASKVLVLLAFALPSLNSFAQTPTAIVGTAATVSISAFTDCGGSEYKATMIGTTFDYPGPDISVGGSRVKCLGYTLVGCAYNGLWDCGSNSTWQVSTSTAATQYVKVNTSTLVVTITTTDFACAVSNEKDNNTTDLDQAGSWTSSVPTSSEAAIWESTVTGANSVALGSDLEFQSVEIQNPGGLVTITAGNTLTIGTGGIDMSASTQNMTIASAVALGSDQDWNVNTSKTLTATGVVSGANKISKKGAGTLTLSGTNTFTGGVDHDAGALSINAAAALGTTAGTFTIASGTTIDNTSGGAITTSNYPMAINGDFTFTGTNDLNLGTGAVALGANTVITATANDLTIGGVVSGAYTLDAAGAGNVILTGTNTYTGTTTVTAGILQFGNGGTTGSIASTSIVNSATLAFNRSNAVNYSGVISSTGAVTKSGAGTLTFTGANTYTGNTTINTGTIELGAAGVIADGSKIVMNGGTLSTGSGAGFSETVGALDLSENSTIALGTGNHTLTFAASNGEAWTGGKQVTVTGWVGDYDGSAAGAGNPKLFMGSSADLSASKLAQIGFDNGSYVFNATQLGTGEVVPIASVLPVELISFTAKKMDSGVVLNWTTAAEINSDYFEVTKSSEDFLFLPIGTIPAAGESSSFINYEFLDYELNSGVTYYKLVEYDRDGTQQESKIIKTLTLQEATFEFLHKNGSDDYLFQLSLLEEAYGKVRILTINGQVTYSSNIIANKGNNQFVINISQLSQGYHVIVFEAEGMPPKTVKFYVD